MKLKWIKFRKKRSLPHKPDVLDGGMKSTDSAVERMIDEGLGAGNTDPEVNGSLDPIPSKVKEDDDTNSIDCHAN